MRGSLPLRLFGLSMAVALCSIAATAWLTTRDTGHRFKAEWSSTLEADSYVHRELLRYAERHDSWDGAGGLVAELADAVSRPIGLTTIDGTPIASSAGEDGQPGPDLTASPVAEIDARSTALTFTAGTSGWRLTEAEVARRERLASEATACLAATYPGNNIVVRPDGTLTVAFGLGDPPAPAPSGPDQDVVTSIDLDKETATRCLPAELHEPGEAARAYRERLTELVAACPDSQHPESPPPSATWHDDPPPSATPLGDPPDEPSVRVAESLAASVGDPIASLTVTDCHTQAQLHALAPFVAEPALLFIGSSDRFDPFSDGGWQRTGLTGLAVLSVSAALTVFAGRRLTRPIRALTVAAQRMGAGDRSGRVPIGGQDDVARLGRAFNSMADSIEAGERQRKAMVTDIAHELRTPLANIRGYLEAAEDDVVPLDGELVSSLLEESAQLLHLIEDLQELALADAGQLQLAREPVDVADLAGQVVAAHQAGATTAGLTLTAGEVEPATAEVDPKRIRQALGNLVANALRYTPAGGEVVVGVRRDGERVRLSVTDDGPGIAPEHLPHVFERFYRGEPSRSRATGGSGLGLAITRQLVEANGGTVEVTSAPGAGSVFTITLPVTAEPDRSGGPPSPREPAPARPDEPEG